MICTSIQHKTYAEIMELLPQLEMAEIRLDLCPLSDNEIEELFAQTDIPLVATCRGGRSFASAQDDRGAGNDARHGDYGQAGNDAADWKTSEHKLSIAVQAGARFADLEIEAPPEYSRRFQKLCRECGTELIRSHHDYVGTPDDRGLQMALARCFRYGATSPR